VFLAHAELAALALKSLKGSWNINKPQIRANMAAIGFNDLKIMIWILYFLPFL
jgi:hypothetical protein